MATDVAVPSNASGVLAGHNAIVTGSGQNIGRAIAVMFAREGAKVVINGHRNRERVDRVVAEIKAFGGDALGLMADVGDPEAMADMLRQAKATFGGPVDIAVSNVATRMKQPFLDISIDDWNKTLNNNLSSAFYLARSVIPDMKAQGWGRIIHISGVDGFAGHIPTRAHNIVCKAGVHALSKALAVEFGEFGITANTVSPGTFDTERDWTQYPPDLLERRKKEIPLRRIGHVDEMAAACTYLASNLAGFVTGQVIHINGGQYMY